jgi:hypothetical protein
MARLQKQKNHIKTIISTIKQKIVVKKLLYKVNPCFGKSLIQEQGMGKFEK